MDTTICIHEDSIRPNYKEKIFLVWYTCLFILPTIWSQSNYCGPPTSQIYEGGYEHFLHIFHFASVLEVFYRAKSCVKS